MIITNESQLVLVKNLISPKSGATTTDSVPTWNTFCEKTTIESVSMRTIVAKSDKKEYNILEGNCKFGSVQLTIDEAATCLKTKAQSIIYKRGKETEAGSGKYYLTLIIGDKPVGKITTPVEQVEQDGAPV